MLSLSCVQFSISEEPSPGIVFTITRYLCGGKNALRFSGFSANNMSSDEEWRTVLCSLMIFKVFKQMCFNLEDKVPVINLTKSLNSVLIEVDKIA
ncbi:hypothetical protein TNCT_563901 [Trichonephila clavata]|uniref:Uncharacterized protein n=1 Tax=Trichonephila clavata TaxID=2740835 RepID=A0A8X6IU87_TRICU|nr:hypothetical protein TNCT_563901 [Trichonephila clavata]